MARSMFALLVASPIPLLFFFTATAPTEIYTLSLHDALPISTVRELAVRHRSSNSSVHSAIGRLEEAGRWPSGPDRKSTRLNSSHSQISYAVFCLKKKKKKKKHNTNANEQRKQHSI